MKTLLFILMFILLVPLTASAQTPTIDLVSNNTFDVDVSGWTPAFLSSTITWSNNGNPGGAGAVGGTFSFVRVKTACTSLTTWPESGGQKWVTLTADIQIPSSFTGGIGYAAVNLYNASDCTSSGVQIQSDHVGPGDTYTSYVSTHDIGSQYQSADVSLFVTGDAITTGETGLFDNVSAYSSTANAISMSNFSAVGGGVDTTKVATVVLSAGIVLSILLFYARRRQHAASVK